jgi:hypothetical protein
MTLSMYQASTPMFVRQLTALAEILKKGAAFAAERQIEPSVLLNARLSPDQFALIRQVQIVTDGAKVGIARLAGVEAPSYPDDETTFDQLDARIAKTIEFLKSVPADQIDGSEDRAIQLKTRRGEMNFVGQAFLLHFLIPNFFFHVTTAYAILRHNGVSLGKMDYLGVEQAT